MFNLFISIKPNILKFTLLIGKVTFEKKFFQQNLDLIGHNTIKQYARGEKYLFSLHLKKTRWLKARGDPRQGTFPYLCVNVL